MHKNLRSMLAFTLLAGCGASVGTTIAPGHVGTKYARLTGYMATRGATPGGAHTEKTPGQIRHEVIRDEATLAVYRPEESCFDVVVRTESTHDEPFDQLSPTCEFGGGGDIRGVVEDEKVSVYDYSYMGEQTIAHLEGVVASEYIGAALTQPAGKVFRVIERTGRVCCPRGGAQEVSLDITNPHWDEFGYKYHLAFEWTLR